MKSERRHDLETNELAKRLAGWIEQGEANWQPFALVIAAIVVGALIWSAVNRSTVAQEETAWNAYRSAIGGNATDFDSLRRAAEQFAGSPMSDFANMMWADGQVMQASFSILRDRAAANEALSQARNVYQTIMETSTDSGLQERARLGLARVYELQNDVEKAREYYEQVGGAFAQFAQTRLAAIDDDRTKDALDWLAAAKPPSPVAPEGPGTPGQVPEFSADPVDLFPDTSAPATPGQIRSLDEILQGYDETVEDRYQDSSSESGESSVPSDTEATLESQPTAD